jgi:hypothetical protein
MALLATQRPTPAGLAVAFVAAAAGGDEFVPDRHQAVHVKNASAGSVNVTIPTPPEVDGVAIADIVVSIAAGAERLIRIPPDLVRGANGRAAMTYSAAAGVTVAVIAIP